MKVAVRAVMGFVLIAMAAPITPVANANPFSPEIAPVPVPERIDSRTKWRATKLPANTRGDASIVNASSVGAPHWIPIARQYMGTNPTSRRSLWCADFLNLVLKRSGLQGTASSMAGSFINYGRRLSGPQVGAIAVVSRGGGAGHVGIVTGVDANGNPILLSGNHNNTVAEAPYSAGRIIAYVWPTS
jgi:uncharacterized protein (TIGR02594 family)